MNKKLGQTVDTDINLQDVEAGIKSVFHGDNGHNLPIGELQPVAGKLEQEVKRPRMEMPHADYQKLKIICDLVNEDISKMLYKVVKTWLDSVYPKI